MCDYWAPEIFNTVPSSEFAFSEYLPPLYLEANNTKSIVFLHHITCYDSLELGLEFAFQKFTFSSLSVVP
jgi:hypothetical protein